MTKGTRQSRPASAQAGVSAGRRQSRPASERGRRQRRSAPEAGRASEVRAELGRAGCGEAVADQLLGFIDEPGEVVLAFEALGVDFVDLLGA